jgi:hypothetical protein
MMDVKTLDDLCGLMGAGEKAGAPPHNLMPEEQAAFLEIERSTRRLEQEKIPLNYSIEAIARLAEMRVHSAAGL